MTEAEKHLWYLLRAKRFHDYKFKRQYPIGKYIVDFVCLQKRLIIELDGGQHADCVEYDRQRTAYLKTQGYQVLRFWNSEVFQQTEGMLETILSHLET